MRFSSKTFKRSHRNKKFKKTRKQKRGMKQKGGSAGVLYRGIPKEATISDAPTDGLE